MRDVVRTLFSGGGSLGGILLRLVAAMVLGAAVGFIYRRARSAPPSSFTVTLVLLSILIAMVTQVIGDNVARAFSLVGALSIVRFRTVVRDTQDTAYVIFSVAVGMAVGAGQIGVAVAGIGIVAIAAALMRHPSTIEAVASPLPYRLQVRLGLGHDADGSLSPTLDSYVATRSLMAVSTVRQGAALEFAYHLSMRRDDQVPQLVSALNRIDGVQGVSLERSASGGESGTDRPGGVK